MHSTYNVSIWMTKESENTFLFVLIQRIFHEKGINDTFKNNYWCFAK